jgi:hypothetical protein
MPQYVDAVERWQVFTGGAAGPEADAGRSRTWQQNGALW